MGTRGDFYVGRGEEAERLGSISFDAYPDGVPKVVLKARSEDRYRLAVLEMIESDRRHNTLPEDGWPWPWDDSGLTDYAYAFEDGKVLAHGSGWFDPLKPEPEEGTDRPEDSFTFPDMKDIQNVTFGGRSGLLVIGSKGVIDD